MATSRDVRDRLVKGLRRDLVGPGPADADLERELLDTAPSRWYLAGFLAPAGDAASAEDPDATDDLDGGAEAGDDFEELADPMTLDGQADGQAAQQKFLPSSLGLSFLLEPEVLEIEVEVSWGDYRPQPPLENEGLFAKGVEEAEASEAARKVDWRREPRVETLTIPVPKEGPPVRRQVPGSAVARRGKGGLELVIHARPISLPTTGVDRKVRSVALFLVNSRPGLNRHFRDVTYAFQAGLKVRCGSPIVARSDLSGYASDDLDLRIADLHYGEACEYAVGRNTSADWNEDADGQVRTVWTEPLPRAQVEPVAPNLGIGGVTFGMEALAAAAKDDRELRRALENLPAAYDAWIETQTAQRYGITGRRRVETAELLVHGMGKARERIASAIERLTTDAHVRKAFSLMNAAMAQAARRRTGIEKGADPASLDPPTWYPFQLAFILLNLDGLADRRHDDRRIVDLLFFPTGGGKTEAYLGLAAFTICHRRIMASGVLGAGVTVIMRYTLRLLTLDQLGRAAGLICALELLREEAENQLGAWPIEIGLWVGSAASPNRLNDKTEYSAAARLRRFLRDGKNAPSPLKSCPWCGTAFEKESFRLWPSTSGARRLLMKCAKLSCDFSGDRHLPILVTDEEIYRRLPAFMIATIDKFAALPWEGETGAFFGHVARADGEGFYGPAVGGGQKLEGPLAAPDLIIQDELHLITGPLGTVAALYECAIDRLASRQVGDGWVRPKIIASTATARRASEQIRALFDREETQVFPPPGLDRRDSFFAKIDEPNESAPPRLYVGVAAIGKGLKLVFLRTLRTLLAAAQKAWIEDGGEAADPYLTAVCYFNSLRELGSARRIVEDDVRKDLIGYGATRVRLDPTGEEFADRVLPDPVELTSRVSTDEVASVKRRLEKPFPPSAKTKTKDVCDVALATNMISVGLDIPRLGLMVVNGQPKTASEYIQATSRVGRQAGKPGLVVTLLNPHKPRDRAHYESFRHFHEAFYRAVEGASVTPFAPRALDRGLPAVAVAMARHLEPRLAGDNRAGEIVEHIDVGPTVAAEMGRRAEDIAKVGAGVSSQTADLLAAWERIAEDARANGVTLGFTTKSGASRRLLHEMLDPLAGVSPDERRFRAPRSMRGVESAVKVRVRGPYQDWLD